MPIDPDAKLLVGDVVQVDSTQKREREGWAGTQGFVEARYQLSCDVLCQDGELRELAYSTLSIPEEINEKMQAIIDKVEEEPDAKEEA